MFTLESHELVCSSSLIVRLNCACGELAMPRLFSHFFLFRYPHFFFPEMLATARFPTTRGVSRSTFSSKKSSSSVRRSPRRCRQSFVAMSSATESALDALQLNESRFLSLLEKLIGESQFVQNTGVGTAFVTE